MLCFGMIKKYTSEKIQRAIETEKLYEQQDGDSD